MQVEEAADENVCESGGQRQSGKKYNFDLFIVNLLYFVDTTI